MLTAFKSYYFDNKARTIQETPSNPWQFQNSALFGRLDAFLDRCNDVLNLSQTALQFHKLERVEIGGTKVTSTSCENKSLLSVFAYAAMPCVYKVGLASLLFSCSHEARKAVLRLAATICVQLFIHV